MNQFAYILSTVLLACCVMRTAEAMWADIPLEKLIADNPVVLIGTIESISPAQAPDNEFDTAHIKVSEILKHTLENRKIQVGDGVGLSIPAPGKIAVSTDIRYKTGTAGVWILEFKDGSFWATYPKDLQPLKQKEQIARIVREQAEQRTKPSKPSSAEGE